MWHNLCQYAQQSSQLKIPQKMYFYVYLSSRSLHVTVTRSLDCRWLHATWKMLWTAGQMLGWKSLLREPSRLQLEEGHEIELVAWTGRAVSLSSPEGDLISSPTKHVIEKKIPQGQSWRSAPDSPSAEFHHFKGECLHVDFASSFWAPLFAIARRFKNDRADFPVLAWCLLRQSGTPN